MNERRCITEGDLQAYLDGEMGAKADTLAAHVSVCRNCSDALERLRGTAGHVDELLELLAGEPADPVISPARHPHRAPVYAFTGLAACLVLAVFLLTISQRSRTEKPRLIASSHASLLDQTFFTETGADAAMTMGKLLVVRLDLPVSALGYNTGEGSGLRVPAEVLVDEDGTAYAVRPASSGEGVK